jgi:hypothetical protein
VKRLGEPKLPQPFVHVIQGSATVVTSRHRQKGTGSSSSSAPDCSSTSGGFGPTAAIGTSGGSTGARSLNLVQLTCARLPSTWRTRYRK